MNRIYPLTNTIFHVVLRNYVLLRIFKHPRNTKFFAILTYFNLQYYSNTTNNIGLFGLSGQRVATSVL